MKVSTGALVCALLIAGTPAAAATQIKQTFTIDSRSPFELALFDTTKGQLTAVRLSSILTIEMDLVVGRSANSSEASGSFGNQAELSFDGEKSLVETLAAGLNVSLNNRSDYSSSQETERWPMKAVRSRGSSVSSSAIDFFKGNGPGVTVLNPSFAFGHFVSAREGSARIENFAASATVEIIYEYEAAAVPAVPEPATWAMMIGGFALVGGAMRRRQPATVTVA